ncbi:peptidylprolyl isomerase [Cyanobium sp. FGCU-52]|nr:peptidylprolyl isomerase [Cyanobium sp. FGCU52]
MLPVPQLHSELLAAVHAMARRPLHELLDQQGILQTVARDLALEAIRREARFCPEDSGQLLAQVCAGLPCAPPQSADGDWIASLPVNLQDTVRQRWDHLRLQKALEDRYGERVEAHFLERREDLEHVVFRLMRLPHQGLAEELYLRLVDDDASFGDLAARHSLGEESLTRGIVGPIEVAQLQPSLRAVLRSLTVGEIHPPVLLDQSILLVRLEHRRPTSLNESLRHRLLQELLQPDLQVAIDGALKELRRSLDPAVPPATAALALARG